VATDEKAMAKVEGQLAAAGLLIERRVRLVLRDDVRGIDTTLPKHNLNC